MKVYMLIFLLILISCNDEKVGSIVVSELGIKFYLDKNIGKVYKNNRQETFSFYVSKKNLNEIKNIYLSNKLYNLPNNTFYYSTKKIHGYPTNITTITVEVDNKKKEITFQDDGSKNPLERFPNNEVREFYISTLQIIEKIKDSAKVRSDIPTL